MEKAIVSTTMVSSKMLENWKVPNNIFLFSLMFHIAEKLLCFSIF